MGVIGDTLSEARTRRAVDLEQVEAATGVRVRYLRAIEDEDWEALPEDFYARSFIRKYAQYLDVDGEPLVEEYRRQSGAAGRGGAPTSPFARTTSRRAEALRRRRRRQEVYTWVGAAAVLVAIVVAVVLLASSGGTSSGEPAGAGGPAGAAGERSAKAGAEGAGEGAAAKGGGAGTTTGKPKAPRPVALTIEPTGEVWSCVLDGKGKRLVNGVILTAGETRGPFHSHSYSAAFGNGSVTVTVDGRPAHTPKTPSPMGFSVDRHGKLHQLPEGKRPSCE